MVLPSGRTSRVRSIATYDGDLEHAFPPMSVTVCLEDEIDISRGDMLVPPAHLPYVARRFEAMLVWMNQKPLDPGRPYVLKHTTQQVGGAVTAVRHRVNINTLEHEPAEGLGFNEIAAVLVESKRPLFFDAYGENRATGAFIVIDPLTNETVAAGMITSRAGGESARTHPVTADAELSRLLGISPDHVRYIQEGCRFIGNIRRSAIAKLS